jgi:hypothetical protein
MLTIACANNLKNFRYLAARAAKDLVVHHWVMSGSCIAWRRFLGASTDVNKSSDICDSYVLFHRTLTLSLHHPLNSFGMQKLDGISFFKVAFSHKVLSSKSEDILKIMNPT